MSIWNKILIGLIIVVALVFWYFSMQALRLHQDLRTQANQLENEIREVEAKIVAVRSSMEEAPDPQKSIDQLQLALQPYLADRGRVWREVVPGNANPQTGEVSVTVELPDPHGIAPKTLLYAFEATPAGENGDYLGEFVVEGVTNKQIGLRPARRMTTDQLTRLAQSKGPWTLYELMPIDKHWAFADLSEEELKRILPEGTVAEYIREGEPATWQDLKEWGVRGLVVDEEGRPLLDDQGQPIPDAKGFYSRQLRDYKQVFDYYHNHFNAMVNHLQENQRDLAKLNHAVKMTSEEIASLRTNNEALTRRLAEATRERDAVANHAQNLDQHLALLESTVEETIRENQRLADQIAQIQRLAVREIDARAPLTTPAAIPGPAY
ncbi:MAG: hypothetical protein ACOY3P_06505 [Planctomycetota bacterium]